MVVPIVYRMENKPPDNPTGISGFRGTFDLMHQN